MHTKNDPRGKLRGETSELRAWRALGDRVGNPSWLLAIRRPTAYEDSAGVDLACLTADAGEIAVQVKSSERGARKFRGTYRDGSRGSVPIAVVVVNDGESNDELGRRAVAAVGTLRDEVRAVGRAAWSARKDREFQLTRALRFRTSDLDVDAAETFMRTAENLSDAWPLWLEQLSHVEGHARGYPAGTILLSTNIGFPLCLYPTRSRERIERLRAEIGPVDPRSIAHAPVLVPDNPDVAWLDNLLCSHAGKRYRRLARFLLMDAVRRDLPP